MTQTDIILIVLSALAASAAMILAIRRFRFFGIHTRANRRILLADIVIVVALVELVLDAIAEALPRTDTMYEPIHLLAITGRGAVAAGVLALLLSFPGDLEE